MIHYPSYEQFVFDRLVDPENICNLQREQQALRGWGRARVPHAGLRSAELRQDLGRAQRHHRGVPAPARAPLRPVCGPAGGPFHGITEPATGCRPATLLRRLLPVRNLLENAGRFLGALRPEIALDPQTGSPSLSLHARHPESQRNLQALWEHIAGITEEVESLIVLDEFQDVAFIEEAPAQLRTCLEALGDVPILFLGSKRHLLADLFAGPEAPLSAWGTDLTSGTESAVRESA